jgi:tRNA dimethylallyltransferase
MFEGPGQDEALRERLRSRGLPDLRAELERVDPAAAARIHSNDERRTVRALEVYHLTGTPISAHQRQWRETRADEGGDGESDGPERPLHPTLVIGLDWPIDAINRRINARVKQMIDRGLVDEARALWHARRLGPQSREALGYKQLIEHFEGRRTLDDAIEKIKIETRRFAKNQRTWLKRLRLTPGSLWIDAGATAPESWAGLVLERLSQRAPEDARAGAHPPAGPTPGASGRSGAAPSAC